MQIIKELTGFQGEAVLVEHDARHYVVSSVVAYSGPETLVFKSDADGNVTEWGKVAGGRGMSREEAIADLAASVS
jgi:hypothetical protein